MLLDISAVKEGLTHRLRRAKDRLVLAGPLPLPRGLRIEVLGDARPGLELEGPAEVIP